MAVVYSTSDVRPDDSIAYWLEVVSRRFVKSLVTPDGGPFRATVRSGLVGPLGVGAYECDTHALERSAREIAQAESDDYFVCLQLSGRSSHFQDNRKAIIDNGEFLLLDPRLPFKGRCEQRGRIVAVRVPRRALDERMGAAAAVASRRISSRGSVAALAFGFLTMLPDAMDALDDAAGAKVAEQALDLLALAFAIEALTDRVTLSSRRSLTRTLLKSAIDARLHDPELTPAAAAAAVGISARHANALLAEEGTGLERYIIARRLERCRRTLEDPAQAHRTIGEIAFSWGFADLSHFTRRFKAEFGAPPGEYRRQARAAALA